MLFIYAIVVAFVCNMDMVDRSAVLSSSFRASRATSNASRPEVLDKERISTVFDGTSIVTSTACVVLLKKVEILTEDEFKMEPKQRC